jgi:predicted amidohydrolase YtcJ
MRLLNWIVLPFLAFALSVHSVPEPAYTQNPSPDNLLVLTNVTVVDVRTGALQPEQTVILERNHIYSVGPSKSAKYPRNAASINCKGLYLIPGLWDMHVHLGRHHQYTENRRCVCEWTIFYHAEIEKMLAGVEAAARRQL